MIDGLWKYVEEGTIAQRSEGEDRDGEFQFVETGAE